MSLLELLNLLIVDEPIRVVTNTRVQKLIFEGFAMDIKDNYDYDCYTVHVVYSSPCAPTARYYGDPDYSTETVIVVDERRDW